MQNFVKRSAFLVSRTQLFAPRCQKYLATEVLKDQERAQEKIFFDKEDRKAMAKLLRKLESQAEVDRPTYPPEQDAVDNDALKGIFKKYNLDIPQAVLFELIDWKRKD